MPGVPTDLAVHHLNVDPRFKPVKQKKRSFAPERNEVIKKEVGKLLESKIILEVYYPTWLANPVLVKKEDQSWRMCVDFTDLNKGYHQIEMAEKDREKTSFITEERTYCYRTMPFGVKNAGVTYQRLVNKLFQNQIGRSMEVYVDDMIVKSRTDQRLIPDLREILDILWESRGPETRYAPTKKLVLALVHAARKLRPYFQTHSIVVITDQSLRQIFTKPEVSGRMTKWAVELVEHNIGYQSRTAIKTQVLTDFLAEGASLSMAEPSSLPKDVRPEEPWMLFVDGVSSKERSGAGLLLTSPTGEELTYALRFDFPASNNEAGYEALLTGLRIAHQMGITAIKIRSDSQLVVHQVRGEYEAKEDVMKKYLVKVREAIALFETFEIERVPRSQNKRVDALSKLASSSFAHLSKEVLVEVVKYKSIDRVQVLTIDSPASWITPLADFLSSGVLPENKIETRRLQFRDAKYAYAGGTLYRRSYLSPG
ncbi:uncharacterized protein [Coffea arabica]|uniref:Uncharacterized protein n=1 Tax=Coffea arabica TaxID=13443 RepID=A0ABM4V3E7_COFAR